jgi:alkanesulfonate monooxygenase SsuD/methylene tetrahydromethanopterin reductase-like flavin-dependent oxidoreductase (luciferase family)
LRLGVYFGWHVHGFEELLGLALLAEELGYDAVFVDGDATLHPGRETLDGWTVTTALLARTRRIAVGSLRIVHHWTAARLAQAAASAERIAPGRLRFIVSIGDRPIDARFGLPVLPAGERIRWLDEMLDAARALWRGETVTRAGRYVQLAGASLCPTPPGGRIEIAVAAKGARLLEVVARHADVWEVNLPPLPDRVAAAAGALDAACARIGRDPARIERSMLLFTRLAGSPDPAPFLAEYRRLNPWFGFVPDAEAASALVVGSAEQCLRRIASISRELRVMRPTLDLSGVPAGAALSILAALSPKNNRVDTRTSGP